MIEELYDRPIYDGSGNVYGTSAPNNFELMDKINELASKINVLEKVLYTMEEQVKLRKGSKEDDEL